MKNSLAFVGVVVVLGEDISVHLGRALKSGEGRGCSGELTCPALAAAS